MRILLITLFLMGLTAFPRPSTATGDPSPPPGMVLIPGGAYLMGSIQSLKELDPVSLFQADRHMLGPEDPAHEVVLDPFYIDVHEVTNAEYREYLEATGAKAPAYWDNPDFNQPNQPVVGVSWKDARNFCRWKQKRLPTEAEWEKASRGKRAIKYPWGDAPPTPEHMNFNENLGKPAPVGSYEAGKSDYGVHDLSGNVAEWVQDWHFPEYYLFSPKENPSGPDKGVYKVIRGGHWMSNAEDARLTYRNATVPKIRSKTVGFRCARDVSQ